MTQEKRIRGRPRSPEAELKKPVVVYLTDRERMELAAVAASNDMPVGRWIATAALLGARAIQRGGAPFPRGDKDGSR